MLKLKKPSSKSNTQRVSERKKNWNWFCNRWKMWISGLNSRCIRRKLFFIIFSLNWLLVSTGWPASWFVASCYQSFLNIACTSRHFFILRIFFPSNIIIFKSLSSKFYFQNNTFKVDIVDILTKIQMPCFLIENKKLK
jgi:hypothetical protein